MSRNTAPALRRGLTAACLALAIGATAGCAGMNTTEQRTLSGGAGGAAAGAALGALSGGSAAAGAILGGALGAGGGYLYDQHERGNTGF